MDLAKALSVKWALELLLQRLASGEDVKDQLETVYEQNILPEKARPVSVWSPRFGRCVHRFVGVSAYRCRSSWRVLRDGVGGSS